MLWSSEYFVNHSNFLCSFMSVNVSSKTVYIVRTHLHNIREQVRCNIYNVIAVQLLLNLNGYSSCVAMS